MQYLPGISKSAWVTYKQLVKTAENKGGLIPKGTFDSLKHRGQIRVSGVGGNNRQVLIEYDSLPKQYQKMVVAQYGDPKVYIAMQPMLEWLHVDDVARRWYAEYVLPCGIPIPMDYQVRYARSCDWLNLIDVCLKDKRQLKERLGISVMQFWDNVALLIKNDEQPHDLPGSVDRIRTTYRKYQNENSKYECGYEALVEKHRWGNDYARKVSPKIENLVVSLYCMPHKPYMAEVCKLYREFMAGTLQVVDVHPEGGGEVFDPKDFYIPKSKFKNPKSKTAEMAPYALGESTVDYYLKKPVNVAVVNKLQMKAQDYDTKFRPGVKRVAPQYALSKITMDDIDLPFKGPDGDRVVKSYQVYDVCSEALIGVAFSEDKNKELIMESLRDMFRLIIRKGWGVPWEIEMERHLTSAMKGRQTAGADGSEQWEDGIFTPGAVFPATRICMRAQEKRAEGFIKRKKYGFQKKRPGFQGRFYAKLLTNRLNTDDKQLRFEYERIVDCELQDIQAYNNELHPKQDLYPGMSRWQVLEQNQNPNLPKFQASQAIQFIGYSTATSIRAGIARVQYGDYALPDIELIKNTNYNGEITAYYLPDEDGVVNEVYLFEDGEFLCIAKQRVGFQEAVVEQTADDVAIMQQQWGQQKRFDKMVKEGNAAIKKVGISRESEVVSRERVVSKKKEEKQQARVKMPEVDVRNRALNDI